MSTSPTDGLSIQELLAAALHEDTGDGDHTSLATIEAAAVGSAAVKAKEAGVIAGVEIAKEVVRLTDPGIQWDVLLNDGDEIDAPAIVMNLSGNTRSLLRAERLLLNCMQRMSGIATLTRKYVKAVAGTQARILDTRKTTPNFRIFEKQAVRIGGGHNHRFGLYDMILIKDNHVDASGGIRSAIQHTKDYLARTGKNLKIEIEVRNLAELKDVLAIGGVDRILLDNFQTEVMKEAVGLVDKRFETEASGGITLDNVRQYALTGVDYISTGAITHSYRSLDMNMKITA